MDKQNALQDISYIRQIMNETRQIMDIAWPIYIYWGLYMMMSNIFRLIFAYKSNMVTIEFDHALTPTEISMLIMIVASWGGLFFTAFYIFRHCHKMFDKKMFLIGMLGLSFLLIYVTISISGDILWLTFPSPEMLSLHNMYNRMINEIYFAALFIVFGLVYAREQLWMGYWILVVTILSAYIGANQISVDGIHTPFQILSLSIGSLNVGICFLIAGVMAYNRHRKAMVDD